MNSVMRVTMLGDSALLLPLAVTLALWIATRYPERAVRWFATMVAAMSLTVISKIYYGVSAMPIELIHFRMISGHMVLSYAVWPVLAFVLGNTIDRRLGYTAAVLAGLAGLIIGYTRLFGAHTLSEVIVGTLVGASVSVSTLKRWRTLPMTLPYPVLFVPLLCAIGWLCYGYRAPTQDWIDDISAFILAHLT